MAKQDSENTGSKNKAVGASDFVTEAYNAKGEKELKEFYSKWAEDYDNQMLNHLNYASPRLVAAALKEHLADTDASILDIGCGTGLTAAALDLHGYSNLHGIDLSEEMVSVAGKRKIYRSLHAADVTRELQFANDYFDGAISSGTFTHGHVDASCLPEIFRILKPGGILACTVKSDIWEDAGFRVTFESMENTHKIKCLSRKLDQFYDDEPPAGWFCVYQKNIPDDQ